MKQNSNKIATKPIFESYLSHESNNALRTLTATPELRIAISDPRGTIVQKNKSFTRQPKQWFEPKSNSTR